jgi:hypothetical protein
VLYNRVMSHACGGRALTILARVLVHAVVLAGLAGFAGRAVAQEGPAPARQRVAVVKLAFEGGVPEAARELFAQRLVEGLAAAHFDVLAGAVVKERLLAAGLSADNCAGGSCTERATKALDVAFLVFAAVIEHDKTYAITLELVNGRSGTNIGTNRERCEICGVEEASEKVGLAASALGARLEALARTPARFIIRSRPSGARLMLDGEALGRTPIDRELPGGVHKLELEADDYDPLERTLTAVNGVDETLDLDLVRLPTRFPLRAMSYLAIAVGVLALAGGAWAEAVDGDEIACDAASRDDHGRCPSVRNTRVLGAALVGLGAASATLGGVWLYIGNFGAPRVTDGEPHATGVRLGGNF